MMAICNYREAASQRSGFLYVENTHFINYKKNNIKTYIMKKSIFYRKPYSAYRVKNYVKSPEVLITGAPDVVPRF